MILPEELGLPPLPEPLPRPVIDAHTHLDSTMEKTKASAAQLWEWAESVGVQGMVQVGCDVEDSRWAVEAATDPRVIACVAMHPSQAATCVDLNDAWEQLEALCQAPGVRAVGETGLDYYWTKDAQGQARQQESFRRHIAWAKKYDKTLVIHDREAHGDIVDILDEHTWPERVVFHCFSGDEAFARRCLAGGAWLSFPGTVTFKANEYLRESLRSCPPEKLLVETDAPYLTPMPHRGKWNASYLMPHTVRFMAGETQIELGELCDQLWNNAEQAFGGAWCTR